MTRGFSFVIVGMMLAANHSRAADKTTTFEARVRRSVERSLPLLEIASAETARRRQCFTCHGQAMPAVVFAEATNRGFHIDNQNLRRQLDHTAAHLKRSRDRYLEGRGTGGQVDTAGWALWGLEAGGRKPDEATDAVIAYLFGRQEKTGLWKCSSNRPPSEKSDFTATYLALRAFESYGRDAQSAKITAAVDRAKSWLEKTQPQDTEDRVFRLLSLPYVELDERTEELTTALIQQQQPDGGWAQRPGMKSDAYATSTVLYGLAEGGMKTTDAVYQRGLEFLVDIQREDGSWYVKSRSRPFQTYFETGYPHGKDQFISMTAACWATLVLLRALPERAAAPIETLADTRPLDWPESDLSGRLMIGAHRFVESRIKAATNRRRELKTNTDDDRNALRQQLRTVLGVVEERHPPRLEQFGDRNNPALVSESDNARIYNVRWPVFADVYGEGLWVQQKAPAEERRGMCVVVPDANASPEQLLGLADGLTPQEQIGRRLAANGFDLLIPAIISRRRLQTNDARTQRADLTEREWIYRQAFHMGRHVIGYDLQRVLAAVDCFANYDSAQQIGVVGYGEGGLIALHAAAIDRRIHATLVSGYFNSSDTAWSEPIYRNVWRRSVAFGNAEVASLVSPRSLLIEHCEFPTVTGHKGEIRTPPTALVKSEFANIRRDRTGTAPRLFADEKNTPARPWSDAAVETFSRCFGIEPTATKVEFRPDTRANASARIGERQARCMQQAERNVQALVRQSEHVRDNAFLYKVKPEWKSRRWSTNRRHDTEAAESFVTAAKDFRKRFAQEAMGRFQTPLLPPNARTRKVAETDKWTTYDVVLDVHESLFAWGVLVLPNDLQPGERRPVVVCQHGRNGVPRDTIDNGKTAYNDFAAKLAERGFIAFAPHNLYRGEDRYRWLDRKANAIGCTLFSFILSSHEQILNWLDSLPFVDGDRIAFYGLSYGGETAVRVPAVLEKYCLSVCSGDFNQWTRKVAATDQPFSFMRTIEWEMPYWNLGHTFDYAEMTYLMFPRPFMVERGHHDRVGRDRWVAHEFAKVRWFYAQFGLSDRVAIEYFQGGHSINGKDTFTFLHKHLNRPPERRADEPPETPID